MSATLGIAVTTYNRRDMLLDTVRAIRAMTTTPYELVVCDDGSSDGTIQALEAEGVAVLGGLNRGIAWNKNRGLFYLSQHHRCDTIILLDDDAQPAIFGWEREWIEACRRFGHVNFIPPHFRKDLVGGRMTASAPGVGPVVGGMAIGQSAAALSCVGYMDVRFGRYGHEHSDFTGRFTRAGFGGFLYEDGDRVWNLYYLIHGGIELVPSQSSGSSDDLERNARLLGELVADPVYRSPWRSDEEMRQFLAEMPRHFGGSEGGLLPPFTAFDGAAYLEKYVDVREADLDPLEHYIRIGHSEGRQTGSFA